VDSSCSSNTKGGRVEIVIEGSEGLLIEQFPRFDLKRLNNQVEYEVLIVRLGLAQDMGT